MADQRRQIPFAISSEQGRSDSSNGSRLVNLFAEYLNNTGYGPKYVLYGTPGTDQALTVPTWPVKAMILMGDKVYVVTSSRLYRFNWAGVIEDLGAVVMKGMRVSIATNGIQVVFVDGFKGYAYDKSTHSLVELEGTGWYPASTVTHQDGYFIFNRKATGQFFISKLLSVEFDATMWATAEAAPDNTECVISDERALWIFGKESGEIWYDSGDALFPFAKVSGAYIEVGIMAPYTAAKIDNSVFWLGSDGVVYRTSGYVPTRVSTHAVEFAINMPGIDDAFAYTYSEEGHYFYVLTFPTQKMTWVYDTTTKLWHERSHWSHGRHVSNCYCKAFGKHFVGDFQSGAVYIMRMGAFTDNGDILKRVAISPQINARGNMATMYSLEVEMESGVVFTKKVLDLDSRDLVKTEDDGDMLIENEANILLESDDGNPFTDVVSSPQVMLQWSDDGKRTWSKGRWKELGKIGEYTRRAKWGPLGMFQKRNIMLTITDPVPVVINGVYTEYH